MTPVFALEAERIRLMTYITDLEAGNIHPDHPWIKAAQSNVEIIDTHIRNFPPAGTYE